MLVLYIIWMVGNLYFGNWITENIHYVQIRFIFSTRKLLVEIRFYSTVYMLIWHIFSYTTFRAFFFATRNNSLAQFSYDMTFLLVLWPTNQSKFLNIACNPNTILYISVLSKFYFKGYCIMLCFLALNELCL